MTADSDLQTGPVFVIGCQRSGTTLLRLMLLRNPGLHIPYETNFLRALYDLAGDYGNFSQTHQRLYFIRDLQRNPATRKTSAFSAFALTVEEMEAALCRCAPTDFFGAARAIYEASAFKQGKRRWGDKTPDYTIHVKWLAEKFPDARFVHIIRDGRDVALSISKAGFRKSLDSAVRHWDKYVRAARCDGQVLGSRRYCEIRYEHLILEPEQVLRKLCDQLKLGYCPEMLQPSEETSKHIAPHQLRRDELLSQPVDPSRVGGWRMTMTPRQIAECEEAANQLFRELGYEVTGNRTPRTARVVRAALDVGRALSHRLTSDHSQSTTKDA